MADAAVAAAAGGHRLGQPHSIGRLLAEEAPRPRIVLVAVVVRQQSSDVGEKLEKMAVVAMATNFQT